MARRSNPFKPTAGATPPTLIGRGDVLDEIEESLEDGPGAPARLTSFTGARGIGKTVMLSEVARRALQLGWVTIDETATEGLLERLVLSVRRELHRIDPGEAAGRSITGLTLPSVLGVGGGGVTISERQVTVVTWRDELNRLLDALAQYGGGLMITVDEVQDGARADLRDLGATIQHLIREDRDVALMAAGLPSAISELLNDKVLTFLRRAHRVVLDDVPLGEVSAALRTTITENGRSINDDALQAATDATGGYPFMVQLVGYHVWRTADADVIDMTAVRRGVPAAQLRLGSTVHQTAVADLSPVDRTYLLAMAQDDGESSTREISQRLEKGVGYGNVYRRRLIDAGLIEPTRHGYVDFSIPCLRDCLREHAAGIETAARTDGSLRT